MITRRGLAAGMMLAGAGVERAAAEGFPNGTVRIGVLTDMSGVFSGNTGAGSVMAARMAIEDAGGRVRGVPVELISGDHGNKTDTAAGLAREWIDRRGVDVIADLINSAVALAVMQVASEKNRITLVLGSGSTRISNENCSATNVQWAYDSFATANASVRALLAGGDDTWFFITADYAFGHSAQSDAAEIVARAGGKVVGSVLHPLGTSDFSSQLLAAQASGAKVVALANAGADSVNCIKQAAEFGLTGQQKLVGLVLVINDVHALGLAAAQGLYLSESFYWDRTDASRAFSRRFFERMRKMPNMAQAGMYSAVRHYLRAVEASGTTDTATVMAQMRGMPVSDMFAEAGHIRDDGLLIHDLYLLQVKAPQDSSGEWDLLRVVKTVQGEEAFAPLTASRCRLIKS